MISVLIPIYNYCVVDLVNEIHKQLTNSQQPFEIICFEDGSDADFVKQNTSIKNLSNTSLIISKSNIGRIQSRKKLSELAKYNWLLFLDSDVMPKSKDFISNYLKMIDQKLEVVLGGVCYDRKKPDNNHILRWKYGILQEEVPAKKRNENRYKNIVSANLLIKKMLFKSLISKIEFEGYGLDNYFAVIMKEQNIIPIHIDNEVIHLGIEPSEAYLKKMEGAVLNLLKIHKNHGFLNFENDLYSFFIVVKRYQLHFLCSTFYTIFKSGMKQNLLGKYPSITLLQFYKISLMCHMYLNKSHYDL